MQNLIENWKNLSNRTKKTIIAIVAGTAAIAIFGVLALKFAAGTDYSTLFTDLNQEEAQEVVALLQEEGVDYQFDDKNGAIRVASSDVDQTRAGLLSRGYPKSGFTYDMYRDNATIMTTESDKKQYTLYELQDRLGAQIRLFEGVMDAKVTIAEAGEQRWAKGDDAQTNASASVVVTMKNGQSLTADKAAAIKNLIARAVKGMNFTNVSVFDAVTMVEVDPGGSDEGGFSTTKDMTALTSLVESNIAGNIRRVLEMLYGQGNVAISVKGTLNMERLIQENTQYSTPDKIDENDKNGLLQRESVTNENSALGEPGAGGVTGADANADVPRYTNQNNETQAVVDSYANSSATREWLYNSVKEQRQIDPGVLENTTVGIVILTNDNSVTMEDLTNLIANSAGIPLEAAAQNITVVRAPLPEPPESEGDGTQPTGGEGESEKDGPGMLPIIIAAAAGVLLLLMILLLIMGRKKRKRLAAQMEADQTEMTIINEGEEGEAFPSAEKTEADLAARAVDEEMDRNEEILNLRLQHSLRLKQNIGEFVDQNPQIAAKLVQSWLRGEGETNGPNRSGDRSKQK